MLDVLRSVRHVYRRDCGPIKLRTTTTWIMCLPIGSMLLRIKFYEWSTGILAGTRFIPRATGEVNGSLGFPKSSTSLPQHLENLNLRKTMLIIQVLTQRLKIRTFPGLLSKIFKSKDFSNAGRATIENKFSRNKDPWEPWLNMSGKTQPEASILKDVFPDRNSH